MAIAHIVVKALESTDLRYPQVDDAHRKKFAEA
jgi:hypothetical protein